MVGEGGEGEGADWEQGDDEEEVRISYASPPELRE